ncbi:MAG: hypothetical protein KF690_11905 [Bacteroidetes bacterium]|nr:hypothetical protein [Bacteroidota bacterium]
MNNLTSYHPTSCAEAVQYLKQCCARTEKGGVRHMILVDKYYQPTLESALDAAGDDRQAQLAAWFQALQADKLVVIPNVLGNYNGGEPVESQGYGGAQSRTTGMTHTAVVDDVNVVGNRVFAQAIMQSQRYVLWFATSDLIWNTHSPCGISVQMPVEREYTSELKYVYTLQWSSLNPPQHYWLPLSLFDCASFSAAIALESVVGSTLHFEATYESACTGGGTITLDSILLDDGSAVTNVTSQYTHTPFSITSGSLSDTFTVTKNSGSPAAGIYTFRFGVSGCGQAAPQWVEVVHVVV